MQPIRHIFMEAPDFITVPDDLRHHPVEIIIWPLADDESARHSLPPPRGLCQPSPRVKTSRHQNGQSQVLHDPLALTIYEEHSENEDAL